MNKPQKPTLAEPGPEPPREPREEWYAYMRASVAYHQAWRDYHQAGADRLWRKAGIFAAIAGCCMLISLAVGLIFA